MALRDVVAAPFFDATDFRWRVGLRRAERDEWLQVDDAIVEDLAEKEQLLATMPDEVVAWAPRSTPAAAALGAALADACRAAGLTPPGRGSSAHPIAAAGRSVQEDLCLLEPVDGTWRLTAGAVFFPTRWTLREKLGATLGEIHGPVPGYAAIGARVERFVERLGPGVLAARLNWSLVDRIDRRLPATRAQAATEFPDDPERDLFFRVERQTLLRLVDHEAVCFAIRIHVWPLGEVLAALAPDRFASTLRSMPAAVVAYKDLDHIRDPLAAWLTTR